MSLSAPRQKLLFAAAAGASVVAAAGAAAAAALLILLAGRKKEKRRRGGDAGGEAEDARLRELLSAAPPRTISEFESAAQAVLEPLAKVYFHYFADKAATLSRCRRFLDSISLLPTILAGDVSTVDTSLVLFGDRLDLPVLVAPSAFHVLACPEGEAATARGAARAGAGYCYNWMLSSKPYRDVLAAAGEEGEDGALWLHLYMYEERDLVRKSLETALATGRFSAVVLTCDHPHTRVQDRLMPYFLEGEMRHADPADPLFPNQAAMGFDAISLGDLTTDAWAPSASQGKVNPGGTNSSKLSWDDVEWIKVLAREIPVVAKGVLSRSDALRALEAGADAVVVSNHGGRQCDCAVPAVEALPAVVDAVQGKVPVLVDTGIRSSSDVVKALCLGASGVLLGRPPLWALACGGSAGLERMLATLKRDLEDDLRSLGVTSLGELGPRRLWPPDRQRVEATVQACKET